MTQHTHADLDAAASFLNTWEAKLHAERTAGKVTEATKASQVLHALAWEGLKEEWNRHLDHAPDATKAKAKPARRVTQQELEEPQTGFYFID